MPISIMVNESVSQVDSDVGKKMKLCPKVEATSTSYYIMLFVGHKIRTMDTDKSNGSSVT